MNKSFLHMGILSLSLICLSIFSVSGQTQVIAHRGYWDTQGSAQNSIAALEKAQELGIYGSEFDVYITQDGTLVVNHDDSICKRAIETSVYDVLKNCKLKNGETLPTLEQYLITGKKDPATRLILEIKPHKSVVNEDRAVKAILEMVAKQGMEEQVEYISFSMNICKELIRQKPGVTIAYLNGDVSPADLKTLGFTGLDYHYRVFEKNPDWIKEAKELGLSINVWTVNDRKKMEELIRQKVDYITTDKPALLKEMVMNP